jgi:hypothetical protein
MRMLQLREGVAVDGCQPSGGATTAPVSPLQTTDRECRWRIEGLQLVNSCVAGSVATHYLLAGLLGG